MNIEAEKKQLNIRYYNAFASIFDVVSNKYLFQKSRAFAIQELQLQEGYHLLNLPCGTGQNFNLFQKTLKCTGRVVAIDLSKGMLKQADKKVRKNNWTNIHLQQEGATQINLDWVNNQIESGFRFDAILCDFGLSNFPEWEKVLGNLVELLQPKGKLVVLDWYVEKPGQLGKLIKRLKIGQVNLPIAESMKTKLSDFNINSTFANGRIFVASGTRK